MLRNSGSTRTRRYAGELQSGMSLTRKWCFGGNQVVVDECAIAMHELGHRIL